MTPLTPRQLEIAILLVRGWQGKQIAHRLKISRTTVLRHTQAIYRSLDVHDLLSLAFYLIRKGIVRVEVDRDTRERTA
jgi:DNA-binding NarL/FixJ family response regulator